MSAPGRWRNIIRVKRARTLWCIVLVYSRTPAESPSGHGHNPGIRRFIAPVPSLNNDKDSTHWDCLISTYDSKLQKHREYDTEKCYCYSSGPPDYRMCSPDVTVQNNLAAVAPIENHCHLIILRFGIGQKTVDAAKIVGGTEMIKQNPAEHSCGLFGLLWHLLRWNVCNSSQLHELHSMGNSIYLH